MCVYIFFLNDNAITHFMMSTWLLYALGNQTSWDSLYLGICFIAGCSVVMMWPHDDTWDHKGNTYSIVISNIRKHHSVTNDSNWPIFAWKNTPPWIAVNQEDFCLTYIAWNGKNKPLLVSLLNTYSEFIFPLINISESYF